jgi:hypothetical protein
MNARDTIQTYIDVTIQHINDSNRHGLITEFNRLNLVADLQNIKQEVNAAFNYSSPADPPEGSPGQSDMETCDHTDENGYVAKSICVKCGKVIRQ